MNKLKLIPIALISLVALGAWWYLSTPETITAPKVATQPPTPTPAPERKTPVVPAPPKPAKTTPFLPPLRFAPKAGQTLAYHYQSRGETQFDPRFLLTTIQADISQQLGKNRDNHQPSQAQIDLSSKGELYLKFYPYQAGAWQVAARIELTEYLLNGKIPSYAQAIQYPFAFTIDALGRISHYRFVQGLPVETSGAIETLLYSMQTHLGLERRSQWQSEEKDGMGTYQARYRWLNPSKAPKLIKLQKNKHDYSSTRVSKIGMMGSDIQIKKSHIDISLQPNSAWLLSVKQEEQIESVANGYVWSSHHYQFQAQRVDRTARPPFPDDFNGFLAQFNDPKYRMAAYYATSESLDALARNLDINGALAKYLELQNSDNPELKALAEDFFVNYLRLFPEVAFELVDILNGDSQRQRFDENTQLRLWRFMTQAGHLEAQQALAQAALNADNEEITRIRAVIYSHDFSDPQPILSESLWQLYESLQGSTERRDIELQNMSIYAVGAVAYQDRLSTEQSSAVGQQLLEALGQADDDHQTIELLQSLSNYGGEEILPTISPYLKNQNPNVRAAAYDSLRRIDNPEASETLISHYEQEASTQVQRSALFYLEKMPATDTAMQWAQTELPRIADPDNQSMMVKVLGKHVKDYPDNETALRELANSNPGNAVKKEIYRHIQPRPQ